MKAIELTEPEIVALLLWRFSTRRFEITDAEVQRFLATKLSLVTDLSGDVVTLRLVNDAEAQQLAEGRP